MGAGIELRWDLYLLKTLSIAEISDFLSQGLKSGIDVRVGPFG